MHIHCVLENSVKRSSPFWGEHGVAFHIETPDGQALFDTGQSGQVLLHNAGLLDIDLAAIDALALSHAHYDHTGGLDAFMARCRDGLPLYANPDLFRERYARDGDELRPIGMDTPRDRLESRFALRLRAEPTEMLPGVWTSGVIAERPFFEGRSPTHVIREGDSYAADPYADDLSLVLEVEGGLVVICGCCHAGLLNTLAHVKRHFEGAILAVLGGTHLAPATDAMLQQSVDELRETYHTPLLYLNHCTGERAYVRLLQAFGEERVRLCPAGTTLAF